jgi:hypothetical protein
VKPIRNRYVRNSDNFIEEALLESRSLAEAVSRRLFEIDVHSPGVERKPTDSGTRALLKGVTISAQGI